jgi:exosortase
MGLSSGKWSGLLPIPLAILLFAVFGKALAELFHDWVNAPEHSQGLAIVPAAMLVAWLRRRAVKALPKACDLRGLALGAAGCALHLFSRLASALYLSQLAFVLVVAGLIWTFWGAARLRRLALPLLLLTTAIPLPSLVYVSLSMPLQVLASKAACWVADAGGIAIYREGNIIHLAGMSVGVWEACSGLNSLAALIAGGVLLGALLCRLALTRMLVCISAVPIAVAANIARVTGTALLSDWHPAYAMGFYHAFSGWLVFVLGGTGLYGAAIGLRRVFDE